MFEFVRTHQRLMQGLLLLLIMPSFAFFGVQGFNRFTSNDGSLATVAGQAITQQEFDEAQRAQMARMQDMLGPSFDPKMFDTPEARKQALDTLIAQRTLQIAMIKMRLAASPDAVSDEIRKIPAIRNLYKADGTLDVAAYDALLAQVGLTRDKLFSETRDQLLMRELTEPIPQSAMLPVAAMNRLNQLLNQQREVAVLAFAPAEFASKVVLPEGAAKAYYQSHRPEFAVPETLSVQYVVLDQDAVLAQIKVTPEEIAAYYKAPENQARFVVPEQRRASHILIAAAKDASPADREKAKAKAQDILAKVRANPADFAALAKKFSEDPGSAERGGDLDYAPAANYVKPFSDALFALKPNEISDLVETEFGYHIIMLTGDRPGSVRTIDEARPEIEAEIRKQKLAAAFPQAAEEFSNLVYDQADSLKAVIDKFGLAPKTADGIARTANPKNPAPVFNPRVIEALFSADVLHGKHNTAAIEVSPNVLVSARVTADHPPGMRAFDDVKDAISARLTDEAARKLAADAGAARLKALQAHADEAGFSQPKIIARSNPTGVSAASVKAIFSADASKLPAFVGVTEPTGAYSIYRIDRIVSEPPTPSSMAQDTSRVTQLTRQVGELEFSAYLEGLKKRYKVVLAKNAPTGSDTASTTPAP